MEETGRTLITIDEVIALHDDIIIGKFGGRAGLISRSLLESALARPFQGMADGTSFYPSLLDKAAALFEGLIRDHPFVDGNKRTAAMLTTQFLRRNKIPVDYESDEVVEFCVRTATGELGFAQVLAWLTQHRVKS